MKGIILLGIALVAFAIFTTSSIAQLPGPEPNAIDFEWVMDKGEKKVDCIDGVCYYHFTYTDEEKEYVPPDLSYLDPYMSIINSNEVLKSLYDTKLLELEWSGGYIEVEKSGTIRVPEDTFKAQDQSTQDWWLETKKERFIEKTTSIISHVKGVIE